jgi:hypothetical protein
MMKFEWKSEWTVPSVVGVVSFGVGVAIGYGIRTYQNNRLVRSFDEIMDEVESNQSQLRTDLNGHDPLIIEMIEDGDEIEHLDIYIDRSQHPSNSEFTPEPESIFPNVEEDWDYAEEMAQRTPNLPYIIHRDEYEDDDSDDGKIYSKSTLTYYKGDNVLCDDHDTPIYNYEKVASPLTFGKGSGDPSIVYIRNETLEADYEVLLDHGHYQVEVLGEEIEHSFENQKAPLPKFRPE